MRAGLGILFFLVACGGGSGDWVEVDVPTSSGPSVYTVWVFAEDDVWLGHTSVWHFDGDDWNETPLPVESGVLDFWGFAPDDLWAVGGNNVFHWNGTAWSEVTADQGDTPDSLYQAWGASSDDMWAANTDNSRVFHWNGQQWTRTTLQFVQAQAIWGSSSSDIWLIGVGGTYHYDGVTWSRYESDTYVSPDHAWGLWGFAENDVWAAGGTDEIVHWDGSEWISFEEDEVDRGSYNDIWGPSPDMLLAVGNNGAMATYNGTSWSYQGQQLGLQQNFTMLHGSSATNIWATAVDLDDFSSMVFRYQP